MESIKTYLKEVRKTPLLKPKEEIELTKLVKKGNKEAQEKMIRSNLRLVINIAKRYIHLGIPLMDLIEEGNMGLMKAVKKFNPKKGYRFSTYAGWWIKQSITRAISDQGKIIRIPVYMNELIARWKKTKEQLSQKLKRPPEKEDIARKMKIPVEKVEEIQTWITKVTSLEEPIGEEGEDQVMDLIENENAVLPDEEISRFLKKEHVEVLLENITDRERRILDLRFGLTDGKSNTLAEVAKEIGVSRERVRQIEDAALKKLKRLIKRRQKESDNRP